MDGRTYLPTSHPHLIKEWFDTKDVRTVTTNSHYKAQWKCLQGHIWKASVSNRSRTKTGCPVCSGRVPEPGINDLSTTHPQLAKEWADTKKGPYEVSAHSRYRALWACKQGHTWKSRVDHRSSGSNCPYCSGAKILKGFNDLPLMYPELAEEWNDEKDISTFSKSSLYQAQWKCRNNSKHKWKSTILSRTRGSLCPYCSLRIAFSGETDLETTHPALAEEWDDERDIRTVLAGNEHYAQWKCQKGHQWTTMVYKRARKNYPSGCPSCSSLTSKAENQILEYITSLLPEDIEVQQSNRSLIRKELDIYIPELHLAVEFNGIYWHSEEMGKSESYHLEKFLECKRKGVKLITIWEDDWRDKEKAVKSLLLNSLKIPMRSSTVESTDFIKVSNDDAEMFLNTYHLDGSPSESSYYGLWDNHQRCLLAVMSVSTNVDKRELTITRFSSVHHIEMGFEVLLQRILSDEHKDIETVIGISNNDRSWGEDYQNNGFSKEIVLKPDFFYIRNNTRESEAQFLSNTKDNEWHKKSSYSRIWDTGSVLWRKQLIEQDR